MCDVLPGSSFAVSLVKALPRARHAKVHRFAAVQQQSARTYEKKSPQPQCAALTRLLRSRLLVLDFGGAREPDFGVPLGGAAYSAHGAFLSSSAKVFYGCIRLSCTLWLSPE